LRFLRSILTPLALLTVSLQILSLDLRSSDPHLGFTERSEAVRKVNPGSPAEDAGLMPGDRILSVDDTLLSYPFQASHHLTWKGTEESELLVDRGGSEIRLTFVPGDPSPSEVMWRMALAAVAIGTLLTGLVVLHRKKRPVTLTFFGICYSLGFLILPPEVPRTPWMLVLRTLIVDFVSIFLPALFLHFFLLFPARRQVLDRIPFLPLLLYLPSIGLFVAAEVVQLAQISLGIDVRDVLAGIENLVGVLFVAAILLSLFLFVKAYRRMNVPWLRRRFHVTFIGTLAGVTPTLVVLLLHTIMPDRPIPGDRLAAVTLIFVPASFGYAIVRYGVFEIDKIVRRSLAVTLLTAGMILVYFAAYFALKDPLAGLTGNHGFTPTLLALVLILLLFSPVRTRLQRLLDRDLPPEGPSHDRAARDFGRRLRSVLDWGELVREMVDGLVHRIGSRAVLFYQPQSSGNGMSLAYSCGVRLGLLGQARLGQPILNAVERFSEPVLREDLDAELPFGWLEESDRQSLDRIGASVLAAVRGKDRPLGLIVLGPPAQGGSYEGWQLELLSDLLEQGSLALENASYHQEAIREARLRYDLKVARSLQSQLLPREAPKLRDIELAGETVPSQDVGGDYYDFMLPHPDNLVLTVGDVSGKGVPGALLMAHLQAIFRAEAAESWKDPADLLRRINERICDIRRPDRFISLFCATVQLTSRTLRYASAGHPPAFLLRRGGSLERLDLSGLLLGIQARTAYASGELSLESGDLLLGYTDGAIERQTATGFLGEDGLARAAQRHRHLSARDLVERLLAEVRYASERPMEDDTTLLVLKAL
jgi:sigma-B regulation protein RsbU (phosphoserine phosphatase)